MEEGREGEREKRAKDAKQVVLSNPPLFCPLAVGVGVWEGAAWEPLQECFKHLLLLLSNLSYATSKSRMLQPSSPAF